MTQNSSSIRRRSFRLALAALAVATAMQTFTPIPARAGMEESGHPNCKDLGCTGGDIQCALLVEQGIMCKMY